MEDEVGFQIIQLKPHRYNKWHALAIGLNFASDALEGLSGWAGTLSIMITQHGMQKDVDKRFGEVVHGG